MGTERDLMIGPLSLIWIVKDFLAPIIAKHLVLPITFAQNRQFNFFFDKGGSITFLRFALYHIFYNTIIFSFIFLVKLYLNTLARNLLNPTRAYFWLIAISSYLDQHDNILSVRRHPINRMCTWTKCIHMLVNLMIQIWYAEIWRECFDICFHISKAFDSWCHNIQGKSTIKLWNEALSQFNGDISFIHNLIVLFNLMT